MSSPLHVLVLDDNAGDIALLKHELQCLTKYKVKVTSCQDWQQTKALLEVQPDIGLILLDYRLQPGESGLDVLYELRENGDLRPIIVLTGEGDERTAAEVSRAGADDYLIKGQYNEDILRRSIDGAMARGKLRQEKAIL